jgi:hypothetical protein
MKTKSHSHYKKRHRFSGKTHNHNKDEVLDYDDLLRRGLIIEDEENSNIYMFSNDDYDIAAKVTSRSNLKIKIKKSGVFDFPLHEIEKRKFSIDKKEDVNQLKSKNSDSLYEKDKEKKIEFPAKNFQNGQEMNKSPIRANGEVQKIIGDKSLNFNNPEKFNNQLLINQKLPSSSFPIHPPYTSPFNPHQKLNTNMDLLNYYLMFNPACSNPAISMSTPSFRENCI